MVRTLRGNLLYALVAGSLLCACGDSPPDPSASSATPNKPVPRKVEGLPPEMVAAVSAGSTATAISVHFALGATPVVNQALPLDLAITPHGEFDSVSAHIDGPDGLAVTVGNSLDPVTSISPEKIIKHQLVLLPVREGVFMLTVGIDTMGKEGNITRIFSIPVIVSAAAPPRPAPAPAPAAPTKP